MTAPLLDERALDVAGPRALAAAVGENLGRVVRGKPAALDLALVALLSGGHLLIEDVPGQGKTLLAKALARSLGGTFRRVQATPDLLPSELTGVSVFSSERWEFRPGPLFANVVLVDEVNRATPRTQSALLEAMEERQVSVDGVTHPLPSPFFLVATQNPFDHAGTFPLVEGQRDRFALVLELGHPPRLAERELLLGTGGTDSLELLEAVTTPAQLGAAIATVHAAPLRPGGGRLHRGDRRPHPGPPRRPPRRQPPGRPRAPPRRQGARRDGRSDLRAPRRRQGPRPVRPRPPARAHRGARHPDRRRPGADRPRGRPRTARRGMTELLAGPVVASARGSLAGVALVAGLVVVAAAQARGLRLRPTRPAWVLVLIAAALFAVSRTTGSGWLVVLLAGIVATCAVGLALPLVALRGVGVAVEAPTDATVGQPVHLELAVTGRARDLRLSLPAVGVAEVAVDAPATGVVQGLPARRGVVWSVGVDVVAAGPLGLCVARRRGQVVLGRPMEVGPRPLPVELALPPLAGEADEVDDGCRGDGNAPELVRGARAYVVGDPLRLVHWPASARAGGLMVRELEAPGRAPLTIAVDLRGPSEEAEAAAGRAAGLALAALRAGVPVTLATAEADGPVTAPVTDAVSVGRRLARAVAGPPAHRTSFWPADRAVERRDLQARTGGHVIRVSAS